MNNLADIADVQISGAETLNKLNETLSKIVEDIFSFKRDSCVCVILRCMVCCR